MKICPKMTPELAEEIAAKIGKTKPLRASSHVGKKTEGQTGLSGAEASFLAFASDHGWRIVAKEPLALYVLDGRVYTPDFLAVVGDEIALVEVKSEHPLPNEERAEAAFEDATRRNPQILFVWARQDGDGFDLGFWRGGVRER